MIGFTRSGIARLRRHAAFGGMAALVAPVLIGMPNGSGGGVPASHLPPPAKPVPVYTLPAHPVKVAAMPSWRQPATTWPAPGTGTADIAAGTSARAGSLPVLVSLPASDAHASGATPAGSAAAHARVTVAMQSRQAAAAAGVDGVIFTVSASGADSAHISLDYSSFAFADGGGYADRLHLVELPACALTTPQVAACRPEAPLRSSNNLTSHALGADVTLHDSVVLAATTSASGSAGDFTATPLSEAGTWSAGSSSGAFSFSYPIQVPQVPGGLVPQVGLGYDSQRVDGLTSSTNNQASWIGDGWDYQPGFVERSYQSCQTQPPGATDWVKSGDLCWSSNDTTTLSLNGMTTTLVDDPSTGWHAEADGGMKVQYLSGAGNSTHDGNYWVVTDPKGTSYYFGMDQLPGWASGDAPDQSSWNVPVYNYAPGDPCYSSTPSQASCYLPWRWNLDYVTDSHGDAMALSYINETNYYSRLNGSTANTPYQQGGALAKIEYGLRAGTIYGATPAGQVTFTAVTDRTDVPTSTSTGDLACTSGAACNVVAPTFWSRQRLTTIATYALKGSPLSQVDSWALNQTYQATGDGSPPPMWLKTIARTGTDGTPSVPLPPITFAGAPLPNRVETATDLNDGYSIVDRLRMSKVTSETGGATSVSYDSPPSSCTSGNFPAQDADTTLCYADYWVPPGGSTPVLDWFNKYVVSAVTQSNTAGGTTPVQTSYSYAGAAWHYNDDALTRSSQRTWDQWRGFRTVTTQTGQAPDPVTKTTDTYLQGMDGDHQSSGGTAAASVTSTVGNVTVTDSPQYAGATFEHTTYNGTGGPIIGDTVTTPWSSAATATQSQPSPLPPLKAYLTGTAKTQTFTALASGGYREADVSFGHDSNGRVAWQASVPDAADNGGAGDASEDTCTQTSYATNTSSWLLSLAAEVMVTAVPAASCPYSGTPPQALLVSDTRTYYDGSTTLGAAPSAGDATMTQKATSYSGTTPVFITETKAGYDQYGRVTSATDADQNTTTTSYAPATGAEPASQTVTDPMHLTTTTTFDQPRDLPLTVMNPAGLVTTSQYDALGRLTAVWTAGHATGGPAQKTFSYTVSASAPSVVTTNSINDTGGYLPSQTLYDSLGRAVETQAQTSDGGRVITDTTYNSDGWPLVTSNPYYTTGVPSGTLVAAPDNQVPSQTGNVYDGDGRIVRSIAYSYAGELWETGTSYGGNYTTVTPPSGGTATTTYINGLGKTSYIYQYHSATPPSSPPAPGSGSQSGPSGWDQTAYGYSPAAQLTGITDAAGNTWSYTYDLAGNQVSASDPDTGTSNSGYDAAGKLLSATDARDKTTSYTYDADGRKIAAYDTTGEAPEQGGHQLAAWTYDTLAKGQLTSATSYGPGGTGGTAYAETVTGYNALGLAQGLTVSLSAGPLAGSYKESYGYDLYTGAMDGMTLPGGGGLLQENISIGYDTANRPVSLAGSTSGTVVNTLSYTELGQPQQYALGGGPTAAWIQDAWDLGTGRLASSEVQAGSASPVTLNATTYHYKDAGQLTSAADTPSGGPAQVQCSDHDYLGRLTQAWSQAGSDCSPGPSQSAESGAAAPYWEQYAYNQQDALTSQTSTTTDGASATTSYGYAAPGSPQPHAPATQQVTGPFGTTTATYAYDPAGHLTSSTGQSGSQSLSWDDAGRLASATTSSGTTSYAYDASGSLLLQTDPGTATLYLPGEQLTENTATGAVTAVRYYTIGGTAVAAISTGGHLDWLAGNQQGTATLAIDTSSLSPAYRYYDPYGNPVGPVPSSWPGNRGFVNGTTDPSTALTNLGAREYQPATATFVSPDPLLDPYNPQHLNGYAYAQDDPATLSDPTGQCPVDRCGFGIVNNGIVYRHGPIDPGNPGGAWIPASCAGCGSYPVASAPPLTPYQIAVEIGSMPATRHVPTVTDITAITRQYGYTGSADFTIADMVRWLPGAASGWQGDGAWDEFCQGLAGAPESACGTNPFNGHTGIYGDPIAQYLSMFWHHPLQTTLATLRLAWAIAQPEIIAAGAPDLGVPDLAVAATDEGGAAAAGSGMPGVIFRTGSRTDGAITDPSGVSFRNSVSSSADGQQTFRPGDKIWSVDTSLLPDGSVSVDDVPPGHVSVLATPEEIRAAVIPSGPDNFLAQLMLKALEESGSYRIPK